MTYTSGDFYNNYGDRTYERVMRAVKHPFDADDVVQNIFLKVHTSLTKGFQVNNPENWMARITSNAISDWFRARRSHFPLLDDICAPEISEEINLREKRIIEKESRELQENYREIIDLHYNEGLPQSEIATILNISVSNVKQRVCRARNSLRERCLVV